MTPQQVHQRPCTDSINSLLVIMTIVAIAVASGCGGEPENVENFDETIQQNVVNQHGEFKCGDNTCALTTEMCVSTGPGTPFGTPSSSCRDLPPSCIEDNAMSCNCYVQNFIPSCSCEITEAGETRLSCPGA